MSPIVLRLLRFTFLFAFAGAWARFAILLHTDTHEWFWASLFGFGLTCVGLVMTGLICLSLLWAWFGEKE